MTIKQRILISIALLYLTLFIALPTLSIFVEAFRKGIQVYLATFHDENALTAIKLTLIVAAFAVPANMLFGIMASWTIAKFNFVGKQLLITLIDIPFSVSPVIAGLIYVLLFGAQSMLGKWLVAHHIKIIFAIPGLVIATIFVTFPFVARELIPLMQEQGTEAEEVAVLLGANGWQTFWRVTFPNIKGALLYGVLLCNARAMGEFGAVAVVSGHIRGVTTTIPLYVEILYNEYNFVAAFAMSTILTVLAVFTLIIRSVLESKQLTSIKKASFGVVSGYSG